MGRKTTSLKINNEIVNAIQKQHLTKTEIAKKIGYTREAVSKSINNKKMDLLMLIKISRLLQIDINNCINKYKVEEDD